jgi:hypothetical protein
MKNNKKKLINNINIVYVLPYGYSETNFKMGIKCAKIVYEGNHIDIY